MKIIEQSCTLEWVTPDALDVIERAGRTAYKSETGLDPVPFVRRLIKRGHESVLEHASASFRIVCDRGISHELVRHRLASYTQESTRYCRYADGIHVIRPSGLSDLARSSWAVGMCYAETVYLDMLSLGASPQQARGVLPTCLATEIVATMNFREWRHFLRLRTAPAAHPEMQELANIILTWFRRELPVIVEDIQ